MVRQAVESCQTDINSWCSVNWLWRNTAVTPTDLIARRPRLGERSAWYKCAQRSGGGVCVLVIMCGRIADLEFHFSRYPSFFLLIALRPLLNCVA